MASGKDVQIGEPVGNLKESSAASWNVLYQHLPSGTRNNNEKKCHP